MLVSIEVFVNNTNLTELSKHVLKVSDFPILIKSCSIESRNDPSPKSELVHKTKFSLKISYSTHACLARLDQHQTCKPVMVTVVSSNPTWGNFIFLRHLNANFVQKCQKCQICVIYENLECFVFFLWELNPTVYVISGFDMSRKCFSWG